MNKGDGRISLQEIPKAKAKNVNVSHLQVSLNFIYGNKCQSLRKLELDWPYDNKIRIQGWSLLLTCVNEKVYKTTFQLRHGPGQCRAQVANSFKCPFPFETENKGANCVKFIMSRIIDEFV